MKSSFRRALLRSARYAPLPASAAWQQEHLHDTALSTLVHHMLRTFITCANCSEFSTHRATTARHSDLQPVPAHPLGPSRSQIATNISTRCGPQKTRTHPPHREGASQVTTTEKMVIASGGVSVMSLAVLRVHSFMKQHSARNQYMASAQCFPGARALLPCRAYVQHVYSRCTG